MICTSEQITGIMCRVCLGRSVRHSRVIMTCQESQSSGSKGCVCAMVEAQSVLPGAHGEDRN